MDRGSGWLLTRSGYAEPARPDWEAFGRDYPAKVDPIMELDTVAERADGHGKDFDLVLTGSAGGRWSVRVWTS